MKHGMYGLRQAAILAYKNLSGLLQMGGFQTIQGSLRMWKHPTRKLLFNLCVDDFGIKYHDKNDVYYLVDIVEQKYKTKIDWSGSNFLGFHLNWNYDHGYVDIAMPNYVQNMIQKLKSCLQAKNLRI